MENSMAEAALSYARRGWHVFPCKPTKAPYTVRGLHEATVDEGTIGVWWQRWPNAMIGIRTGEVSGLAVVDIDPKNGGNDAWEQLIAGKELPATATVITQSGGRHLYFKWVPGFRNSASKIGPGIDTRGDGGYVIAPPSVHESGREYTWDDEPELADLPDWLHPDKPRPALEGAGNLGFDAFQMKADGSPVPPGGRNNAAASLAGQYLREGDSIQTVLAKLRAWNKANPQPLPDVEVETVAASVARTHLRNNPGAEIPLVDSPPPEPAEPRPAKQADPFPPALLEPPGFVGEIVKWINETAYKPQPILALGTALAFFGAVVGRKVRTQTDLRTNLYVLCVGDTGCGKDHSRKCIKRICEAAKLTDRLLGGEDISSDSAIFGAVHERPSILFQWDEVGHLISASTGRNAASHQRAILPLLMKLFTSASTSMLGKEYANRENARRDLDQPNVCIVGTTVPDRLFGGLSEGEISDGFLGRMLAFISEDPDPIEQDTSIGAVPQHIVEMVKAWFEHRPEAPEGAGNIDAATRNYAKVVPVEDGGEQAFRRFRVRCKKAKAAARGTGLDAIWARAEEHARKIALVVACGESFPAPTVAASVAEYAVALVEHLTQRLCGVLADNIASNDHEREVLYVLKKIKAAGPQGIDHSHLIMQTRRLRASLRNEVLSQLVAAGDVQTFKVKQRSGPPANVYRA